MVVVVETAKVKYCWHAFLREIVMVAAVINSFRVVGVVVFFIKNELNLLLFFGLAVLSKIGS